MKHYLKKLYQLWMKFARFLGRINSRILLTVFYFSIFGFVAIIRKIIFLLQKKENKNTNWQNKEAFKEDSYLQQF